MVEIRLSAYQTYPLLMAAGLWVMNGKRQNHFMEFHTEMPLQKCCSSIFSGRKCTRCVYCVCQRESCQRSTEAGKFRPEKKAAPSVCNLL
jgi:hypothetical protein